KVILYLYLFFFSSRRRHTRFSRDWSSDVCSSDLYRDSRKLDRQETGPPTPRPALGNRAVLAHRPQVSTPARAARTPTGEPENAPSAPRETRNRSSPYPHPQWPLEPQPEPRASGARLRPVAARAHFPRPPPPDAILAEHRPRRSDPSGTRPVQVIRHRTRRLH